MNINIVFIPIILGMQYEKLFLLLHIDNLNVSHQSRSGSNVKREKVWSYISLEQKMTELCTPKYNCQYLQKDPLQRF